MSITARMKVADLLEQHPEAQEVFDDYGIELTEEGVQLTLMALCKEEAINYWELKSDIATAQGWDGAAPTFGDDDDEDDDEDDEWDEDDEEDDDEEESLDDEEWEEEEEEEDDEGEEDWDD